jgi:hypothetical protein
MCCLLYCLCFWSVVFVVSRVSNATMDLFIHKICASLIRSTCFSFNLLVMCVFSFSYVFLLCANNPVNWGDQVFFICVDNKVFFSCTITFVCAFWGYTFLNTLFILVFLFFMFHLFAQCCYQMNVVLDFDGGWEIVFFTQRQP